MLGVGDKAPRLCNLERVGERGRAQIRAEKRNDRTDLGEPKPNREGFGPVSRHEANRLAGGDADGQRPSGILVHARIERTETEALAVADERGRLVVLCGPFRDRARKNAFRIAGGEGDGLKGEPPCPLTSCLVLRNGRRWQCIHVSAFWLPELLTPPIKSRLGYFD